MLTRMLGHWQGRALRLVCVAVYGVVLALPADASPSAESPVSMGLMWPLAIPRCVSNDTPQRRVLFKPDGASVEIAEAGAPSQLLMLREGLLPKAHYLPDGRHVLLSTRHGWVLRLDLVLARLVAEVRVGTISNGSALSAVRADQPSLLAVANAEPHTLVVLDEHLKVIKLLRAADRTGRTTSPVAKIDVAKNRGSFIASFSHMPELWEISYNPRSPEIALGLVHDFQYREGSFVPGYLNPLRSILLSPAIDFRLSESGNEVVSAHAASGVLHPDTPVQIQVVHLDVRRKIAEFMAPGWPVPGPPFAADLGCGP